METRSREGARGKYVSANYAEKGPVKMADAGLAFPLDINNSDLNCARGEDPYRKATKNRLGIY